MSSWTEMLNESLSRLSVERHLSILDPDSCPLPLDDPAAIVSGLPCIHVRSGRDEFAGRRRCLILRRGRRWGAILARCRPLPAEPESGWLAVQWARDRRNRRVPLCATDRRGTIHVLVDLETATPSALPRNIDPEEILGEFFLGEPLSLLLSQAPETRVGRDVRKFVRLLLQQRPERSRCALRRELSMLENLAPTGGLPRALARRLGLLRSAVASPVPVPNDDRVELELSRLVKLVESRALALLRLGPARIDGLLNPGPNGSKLRLGPLMFRLQFGEEGFHPVLQTWSPQRKIPSRGYGHCLGQGQAVLADLGCQGDLYSVVDTVINFRETNQIRAAPAHPEGTSAGYVADSLACMV